MVAMPSGSLLLELSLLAIISKVCAGALDQTTAVFTAAGTFPTSLYSKYYNNPTATSAQVQPVITDAVTVSSRMIYVQYAPLKRCQHEVYPLHLTSPDTVPVENTVDPHPLPPVASPSRLHAQAFAQIQSIAVNPIFGDNKCARCQASLEVAKFLALAAPEEGPALAVELCEAFDFTTSCSATYNILGLGSVITQVIANADVGGYDGQVCTPESRAIYISTQHHSKKRCFARTS